ncbi:hypothetical protein IV203_017620 [Nitzschia inconspicua]|uniref:Uncharacterized protein n=1 Tax=Nitzschia inconspicua TaxID=303405 RepID=A0A9K3K9C7_9STRA|nr:hypothetical protein IV203_017620 [Nitzschia inconspicua]
MAQKRLTNGQKMQSVRDCEQRLANNESLCSIARRQAAPSCQYEIHKESTSRGAKGRLQDYEDEIMTWAFYQRMLDPLSGSPCRGRGA